MAFDKTAFVQNVEDKEGYSVATVLQTGEEKPRKQNVKGEEHVARFKQAWKEKLLINYTLQPVTRENDDGTSRTFYNVTASSLAGDALKQPSKEEVQQKIDKGVQDLAARQQPAPQEIGLWWKELGEWLRMKEEDAKADPFWKALRTAYFAQMFAVLPIEISKKESK